jgi:hypothetical protein
MDLYRLNEAHREALAAVAVKYDQDCKTAQSITAKVSNDYQNAIRDLDGQLRDARRLRPNTCIRVHQTHSPSRRHAAPATTKLPDADAGAKQRGLGEQR